MQLLYWLLAIILAFGAGYWVYSADRKRAIPYPIITSSLRGLVVLVTLLLVLLPDVIVSNNTTEKPVVLLLQDNSASVGVALGSDSNQYRQQVTALKDKLTSDYRVVQWSFGPRTSTDSFYKYYNEATDIAGALDNAEEYFGLQNLGAIVLATDGRYNQGVNPLYRQSSFQGALYTIGLGDSTRIKDLRISKVYANKTTALNNTFEIKADIIGELCQGYSNELVLQENGENVATATININANKYDKGISFSVKAAKIGMHHYVLQLAAADGETNVSNNRRDVFVEVVNEQKNILLAAAAPHPDIQALKDAITGLETYKVTTATGENFPEDLSKYDAIILHGLPSPMHRIAHVVTTSGKPIWFILSAKSDIGAINGMRPLTMTGVAGAGIHEAVTTFNSAFNAFTLPQRIQMVSDKLPPLVSYTGNINMMPNAGVLYTQKTPAGTMPAWAMQYGKIPVVFTAGEGLWRWRMYEFKNFDNHDVIDECIRQTIAFLCANNKDKPFDITMQKRIWSDQEPITLGAFLLNANNEQINTPEVGLTIKDSAGKSQQYTMERNGSSYTINLGIRAGGRYTYSGKVNYGGKELLANGSFVVESTPLEMMETGADYTLLYQMASSQGGLFTNVAGIPSVYEHIKKNERLKPIIRTDTASVPLIERSWYFIIILILAVAEWLLRKYWLAQ